MFAWIQNFRYFLILTLLAGLAGCGGGGGDGTPSGTVRVSSDPVSSPYDNDNRILHKGLNAKVNGNPVNTIADKQNTWTPITLAGVPAGATGVIINLAGYATGARVDNGEGITTTAITRLRMRIRTSGSSVETAPSLRIQGYRPTQFDRNTVLVALGSNNTIEYNYEFKIPDTGTLTIAAEPSFRLQAFVQGFVFDAELNDPFDKNHLVARKQTGVDTSNEGSWNSVILNNAPANASAVILNLGGHARGATEFDPALAQQDTLLRVHVRSSGSTVETSAGLKLYGPYSHYQHSRSIVMVPLTDNKAFEYKYSFDKQGSDTYSTQGNFRARVFVQGYITGGTATLEPFNGGVADANAVLVKKTGDTSGDEGVWNDLPLNDAPADATGVILNLSGSASGAVNIDPDTANQTQSQTTRLRLRLRAKGSDLDTAPSLRINGAAGHRQTSRNSVLVPLGIDKTIQYRYEFEQPNSSSTFTHPGAFKLHAIVQGYVTDDAADPAGTGGNPALACTTTGSPFSHTDFLAVVDSCTNPAIGKMKFNSALVAGASGNTFLMDGDTYLFIPDNTGTITLAGDASVQDFTWGIVGDGELEIKIENAGGAPIVKSHVAAYGIDQALNRLLVKFYTEDKTSSPVAGDLDFTDDISDGLIGEGIAELVIIGNAQ